MKKIIISYTGRPELAFSESIDAFTDEAAESPPSREAVPAGWDECRSGPIPAEDTEGQTIRPVSSEDHNVGSAENIPVLGKTKQRDTKNQNTHTAIPYNNIRTCIYAQVILELD